MARTHLQLLRTLHDDHGLVVEIERIDEQHGLITEFPGEVRSATPKAVYERDLKQNRAPSGSPTRSWYTIERDCALTD